MCIYTECMLTVGMQAMAPSRRIPHCAWGAPFPQRPRTWCTSRWCPRSWMEEWPEPPMGWLFSHPWTSSVVNDSSAGTSGMWRDLSFLWDWWWDGGKGCVTDPWTGRGQDSVAPVNLLQKAPSVTRGTHDSSWACQARTSSELKISLLQLLVMGVIVIILPKGGQLSPAGLACGCLDHCLLTILLLFCLPVSSFPHADCVWGGTA